MKKKNILLFGGTGDLGKEIVSYFFEQGSNIIFSSTSKKKIKNLINKHKISKGTNIIDGQVCNFLHESSIQKQINFAFNKLKKIDIIINCVGLFNYDNLNNISYPRLVKQFKVNALALIIINKFLQKKSSNKNFVKIITLGSSSAYDGFKDTISYCGSKHALLGIIKSLNQSVYKKKIINYCLNVGSLDNKMGRSVKNIKKKNLIKQGEIIKTISYIFSLNSVGIPEDMYLKRFS